VLGGRTAALSEGLDCAKMAQDGGQWRLFVTRAMDPHIMQVIYGPA